jgi:hypothetical protein
MTIKANIAQTLSSKLESAGSFLFLIMAAREAPVSLLSVEGAEGGGEGGTMRERFSCERDREMSPT